MMTTANFVDNQLFYTLRIETKLFMSICAQQLIALINTLNLVFPKKRGAPVNPLAFLSLNPSNIVQFSEWIESDVDISETSGKQDPAKIQGTEM